MRRSTTSAATDRVRLGLLLLAELILAASLIARPAAAPGPQVRIAAPSAAAHTVVPSPGSLTLPDGRRVVLTGLGGATALLTRIAGEMPGAAAAVTGFWGGEWPRTVAIVAADSDAQFQSLTGFGAGIAAATTADGIVFAPGADTMNDDALRIVVRHELFHFAARSVTAADAPRWLTEGVADYVARPAAAPSAPAQAPLRLPTDTDLATAGPAQSQAYDHAWWFAGYVAHRYGAATLRDLYLRACGAGHPDIDAAVRDTLGAPMDEVLSGWRQWAAG